MYFKMGFIAMLPVTAGVIPFGIVMGSVSSHAELTAVQTIGMNLLVFAGSAQLAAIDLMLQKTSSLVVIATGLVINLRFMLYSAAFAPFVKNSKFLTKLFYSYTLTDQTFTVMRANDDKLKNNGDALSFYTGAAICMLVAWHSAVVVGFLFGKITPPSWALDFAVPLSFVALVVPTIKNHKYFLVALTASVLSIVLREIPYNLGLLTSALLAILLGAWLTRRFANEN